MKHFKKSAGPHREVMCLLNVKNDKMDSYLLIKYFKGTATSSEKEQIQSWLANDTDGSRKETYRQMHDIYNGMALYGDGGASYMKRRSLRRRFVAGIAAVAASVAIVFGIITIERNKAIDLLASKTETLYVPAGESMKLTLDDGSSIWLNGDTEIELPAVFGRKDRKITVHRGEILLDVVKDEARPFYVETFTSTVRVLGTKFEVLVDEDRSFCSVILLRGKVEAVDHNTGDVIGMVPDDLLCFEGGNVTKSRIKNHDAIDCWTEGLIDVSELQFDCLMRRFEKAFNINIIIDRPTLPAISYTRGKIRISDGIDHALSVLQLVSDFTYERDYNTNTITIK